MQEAFNHIISGKPYDFYSLYSLDEIPNQLRAKLENEHSKQSIWERIRENPEMILMPTASDNIYHFKYNQVVIGDYRVFSEGQLTERDDGVYVEGTIKLSKMVKIAPILYFIFYLIAQSFIPSSQLPVLQLFMLAVFFLYSLVFILVWHEFNQLHLVIYDILGKSKKKDH